MISDRATAVSRMASQWLSDGVGVRHTLDVLLRSGMRAYVELYDLVIVRRNVFTSR